MTIREMQLDIVEMMKDLDILFEKNGIKYTLLGGSVLGAIRHKGFIPWDDDMDIGVFREDFEKAEELLSTFKPYTYETTTRHIIPDAPIGHLHLVNEKYPIGMSPTIDIFALDYVPSEKKEQKKLRFIANIHHLAVLRRAPQNRGKLNRFVFGVLIKIIPNKLWDRIQTKSLNKIINYTKSKNMIGNIFGFWTEKEYFMSEIYENLEKYQFENLLLPIPKEYDLYLTQLYGDYMQLPPVEKRVPKHKNF